MGQTAACIVYHFALNSFMAARYATEVVLLAAIDLNVTRQN